MTDGQFRATCIAGGVIGLAFLSDQWVKWRQADKRRGNRRGRRSVAYKNSAGSLQAGPWRSSGGAHEDLGDTESARPTGLARGESRNKATRRRTLL